MSFCRNLWYIRTVFVHSKAGTRPKKQYNYDLDSLIAWKNETLKVFGPARKPTKTGKLKKTKKSLDPEVEENLRILSIVSSKRSNNLDYDTDKHSTKKNDNLTTIVTNLQDYQEIPPSLESFDEELQMLECSDSIQELSLPRVEYFQDTELCNNDHSYVGVHKNNYQSENSVQEHAIYDDVAYYEDKRENKTHIRAQRVLNDIVIPSLPPIPTAGASDSFRKKSKILSTLQTESYQPTSDTSTSQVCHYKHISATKTSFQNEELSPHVSVSDCKVKVTRANDHGREWTDEVALPFDRVKDSVKNESLAKEIYIPEMKPIPSSIKSNYSSLQSPFPSVSTVSTQALDTHNLPIEPPESYKIISKIPFCPKESEEWEKQIIARDLEEFRKDVECLSMKFVPSVKTILNKTMSDLNRFFLNRWREGLIRELGEEGFKKHQDANLRNGINLHANILEILSGKPQSDLQISPENEGHWSSLQSVFAVINGVKALEADISHSLLPYRGVFDCLAQYKDMICLIDWKTSKKPRPLLKNTYDDPLQVAAYIGALNSSEAYLQKFGPISHGMIVVAYPDGSPAHVHVLNRSLCEQQWQSWTDRLYNFYQLAYTERMGVAAEKTLAKQKSKLSF